MSSTVFEGENIDASFLNHFDFPDSFRVFLDSELGVRKVKSLITVYQTPDALQMVKQYLKPMEWARFQTDVVRECSALEGCYLIGRSKTARIRNAATSSGPTRKSSSNSSSSSSSSSSSNNTKRKIPDRIEDLEERVRVLEAENAALKQQLMDLKDETVRLELGSIPAYLKRGEHHANLIGVPEDSTNGDVDIDVDDDTVNAGATSIISVPKKCFKADTEIRSHVELVHLLETLRYWVVDTLPDSVIRYALNANTFVSFICVAEDFWVDMPKLKVLSNVARKGVEEGINEQILCALDEGASREIMHDLFLHHNTDTKLRQEVVIRAARLGSLECLQYILGKDRCDELGCDICSEAAKWGHVDCLKYAHEHGCPWGVSTCSWAAIGGHLDCLNYAHEHGCPSHLYSQSDGDWASDGDSE